MARLVLLRHAKSGYPEGVADHDRPLSSRGEREAPLAGNWIQRHCQPTLVLVSTARRTQQTWELVVEQLDTMPKKRDEPRIYEATVTGLLSVLADVEPTQNEVMVVGHNPGLEDLTHYLAGSGDHVALSTLAEKYPTSAIAVLDIGVPWAALTRGCGMLSSFTVPRPAQ